MRTSSNLGKIVSLGNPMVGLPSFTVNMIVSSSALGKIVDVFVTSECIHLCILCLVTRCLFRDGSIM